MFIWLHVQRHREVGILMRHIAAPVPSMSLQMRGVNAHMPI